MAVLGLIKKNVNKKPESFWDGVDFPDGWTIKEQKELDDYMVQFDIKPKVRLIHRDEIIVDLGLDKTISRMNELSEWMRNLQTGTAEYREYKKSIEKIQL